MENKSVSEKLKEYLKNTPEEEIKATWDSGNYLDKGGVKVVDWLRSKGNHELANEIEKRIVKKYLVLGREGTGVPEDPLRKKEIVFETDDMIQAFDIKDILFKEKNMGYEKGWERYDYQVVANWRHDDFKSNDQILAQYNRDKLRKDTREYLRSMKGGNNET